MARHRTPPKPLEYWVITGIGWVFMLVLGGLAANSIAQGDMGGCVGFFYAGLVVLAMYPPKWCHRAGRRHRDMRPL